MFYLDFSPWQAGAALPGGDFFAMISGQGLEGVRKVHLPLSKATNEVEVWIT